MDRDLRRRCWFYQVIFLHFLELIVILRSEEYKNNLNNRIVLSLCIDKNNKLWIGTDGGGINVFEKGNRTAIYTEENKNLSHNSVTSEYCDSQNNIWIGTFMGGVDVYNNEKNTFSHINLKEATTHDARCFYEDQEHNMWIGTSSGYSSSILKLKKIHIIILQ